MRTQPLMTAGVGLFMLLPVFSTAMAQECLPALDSVKISENWMLKWAYHETFEKNEGKSTTNSNGFTLGYGGFSVGAQSNNSGQFWSSLRQQLGASYDAAQQKEIVTSTLSDNGLEGYKTCLA